MKLRDMCMQRVVIKSIVKSTCTPSKVGIVVRPSMVAYLNPLNQLGKSTPRDKQHVVRCSKQYDIVQGMKTTEE